MNICYNLLASLLVSTTACSQPNQNPKTPQDPVDNVDSTEVELKFPGVVSGAQEYRIEQISDITSFEVSTEDDSAEIMNREFCEKAMEFKNFPKGSLNFSSEVYRELDKNQKTWGFRDKLKNVSINVRPNSMTQVDYKVHHFYNYTEDSSLEPGKKVNKKIKQGIKTYSCFVPKSWSVVSMSLGVSLPNVENNSNHCFKQEETGAKKGECIDELSYTTGFIKTKKMVSAYIPAEASVDLYSLWVLDDQISKKLIKDLFVEKYPKFKNQNVTYTNAFTKRSFGSGNFVSAFGVTTQGGLDKVNEWFVVDKEYSRQVKDLEATKSVVSFDMPKGFGTLAKLSDILSGFDSFKTNGERINMSSRLFDFYEDGRLAMGPPNVVDQAKFKAIDVLFESLKGDFSVYFVLETQTRQKLVINIVGVKGVVEPLVSVRELTQEDQKHLPKIE